MNQQQSNATETKRIKKGNMTPANSKDKRQQQTRQERSRAAIEGYSIRFEDRSSTRQLLVRTGQRLDVDGILANSIKEVQSIVLDKTIRRLSNGKPTWKLLTNSLLR